MVVEKIVLYILVVDLQQENGTPQASLDPTDADEQLK